MLNRTFRKLFRLAGINVYPIREYHIGPKRKVHATKQKLMKRLAAAFALQQHHPHEHTNNDQ